MTDVKTFQQLEDADSVGEYRAGESPLDEWYQGIRNIPISDFDDGDLCRACRQQLYLGHVIPVAVARLQVEPLAGDMYDGELLVAMKSVPIDYWRTDQKSAGLLVSIVQDAKRLSDDDDIVSDADELARRLSG